MITLIGYLLNVTFLIALLYIIFVQIVMRVISRYFYFPTPAFFTRLIDNPFRRRFLQKPEVIAHRMHLIPGITVLEVGPGKGSYTKAVAEKILPSGKVHAIDIQEGVINRLQELIEKESIPNIIPKIDDAYNLSFDDESIDRVFAITCLPEIPEPIRVLLEFKRVLKPSGLISLCEIIIDPDYPRRKTVKNWAEEAGLELKGEFGNWFTYQLNFGKKKA
ncbi:MAG: class I SAM-dependent methyltransferase [Candidatus Hodarchaeales archaeon]